MHQISAAALALGMVSTAAFAADHMSKDVIAHDQSVANGVVSADKIVSTCEWLNGRLPHGRI